MWIFSNGVCKIEFMMTATKSVGTPRDKGVNSSGALTVVQNKLTPPPPPLTQAAVSKL